MLTRNHQFQATLHDAKMNDELKVVYWRFDRPTAGFQIMRYADSVIFLYSGGTIP